MEPLKFSVVIPAYNAAATIVASVRSCLAQNLPPAEIIVVDDGSTDGTADLLRKTFGNSILLLTQHANSGPAAARNAGIAAASGTHVAFQDADDVWHPEKLAIIARALQAQPQIHFLFHPYTLRSIAGPIRESELAPRPYPLWKLLLSNPIGTPCAIIRRSANLRFDERLRHMEDYELFLRQASAHGLYRIAAALTQVGRPILSRGGQSGNRWAMRKGEIRAWLAFARHRPLYYLPVLPLILFSLAKHAVKSAFPPRTNY